MRLINFGIFTSDISVEVFSMVLGGDFSIANIYGPYEDRVAYWKEFLAHELFRSKEVITRGDLSLTIKVEITRSVTREYYLAIFSK